MLQSSEKSLSDSSLQLRAANEKASIFVLQQHLV